MLFPQANTHRRTQCLDGIWQFRDADQTDYDPGLFSEVTSRLLAVPGSWNEQIPDLAQYHGVGWYQRSFFIDPAWAHQCLRLRIGSANNHVRAWVNGQEVGRHRGPYLPADFNIKPYVCFGDANTLTISVDARLDPWNLPPASLVENEGRIGFMNSYPAVAYDFFPYGGIHRSVTLYTTGTPRIEAISVQTEVIHEDTAEVTAVVEMADAFSGICRFEVAGKVQEVVIEAQRRVSLPIKIPSPRIWDIGRGELYGLKVTTKTQDGQEDCYEQTFGIRTVEVKGDAFLLNGKPVFFKGFGKHEDFPIVGKGLCEPVIVRDFEMLRWLGANSFRTSHYPYAEEWLDYADRVGMMVIDETPFVGLNGRMYTDAILDDAQRVIRDLIRRDRHHASVVMWSLANEPNCQPGDENALRFFKTMSETAREADPSRPITYVAHNEPDQNAGMQFFDVVCLNKYYGWYIGSGQINQTLDALKACIQRFRDAFPKPLILAEFGADAIEGLHRYPAEMFTEEFQSEIIKRQYEALRSYAWAIGAHVWAFADFKTAQTTSRIIYNRKGVLTRDRQPKLAAHTLRSLWKP